MTARRCGVCLSWPRRRVDREQWSHEVPVRTRWNRRCNRWPKDVAPDDYTKANKEGFADKIDDIRIQPRIFVRGKTIVPSPSLWWCRMNRAKAAPLRSNFRCLPYPPQTLRLLCWCSQKRLTVVMGSIWIYLDLFGRSTPWQCWVAGGVNVAVS